jgi:hypothetical protein
MRNYKDFDFSFGWVQENNGKRWEEMCWYSEQGLSEIWYFLKHFILWIPKKNVYFKFNLSRTPLYLRYK